MRTSSAIGREQSDNPYTEVLNQAQKYVASRTLSEPLPWQNSTLLRGDLGPAVSALKAEVDGKLVVLGSGELVRALTALGLVDRYVIVINPLLLGQGRRLFAEVGPRHDLRLIDSVVTTTGAIIATYAAGEESTAMTAYLLSIIQPDGDPPPPEVLDPIMAELDAFNTELKDSGAWVFTAGLHPASTATVVRAGREALFTDGPTSRARSTSADSPSITAPDLDAALEWGRRLLGDPRCRSRCDRRCPRLRSPSTIATIEPVFREEYGRAVAVLVRSSATSISPRRRSRTRSPRPFERWPVDGMPPQPAGWIITTARNRASTGCGARRRERPSRPQAGAARDRRAEQAEEVPCATTGCG